MDKKLSALKEQKLLRRAEARMASAARAMQNLDGMPKNEAMQQEYVEMLKHMDALALSAGKLHIAAQALCKKRGAEIIHERGTPKEKPVEIADWILLGGMKRVPQT